MTVQAGRKMEVTTYRSLTASWDGQYKLLMSDVSACLPLLQEENATLTSGKQEDGATMRGQCGVSAQMELMSQVNSCSVLWPLYGWITPPRNTNTH